MSLPWRRLGSVLGFVLGAGCLLYAGYIPAKAWLAQVLLEAAWQRTLTGVPDPRPWPWADTQPLARLSQARLGVNQIVLAGSSGRVLAFGPGHIPGTARPGQSGNVVLVGHRDTHFAWLQDLRRGDKLVLQDADRNVLRFVVVQKAVHHEADLDLLDPLAPPQLRLVTCYPFDAIRPGTPWRYVVTAALSDTAHAAMDGLPPGMTGRPTH
ncbi:MAG: class GN sortase [Sedimenticolaceae bacterium]